MKPSFTYTVRGDNKTAEYTVFNLFHGSVFGQKVYVGLGATATKRTQFLRLIIMKVIVGMKAVSSGKRISFKKSTKMGFYQESGGFAKACQNIKIK